MRQDIDPAEVVRLYTVEELSIREIAAKSQASFGSIRNTLVREGVTLRPRGGRSRVIDPDEVRRYLAEGWGLHRIARQLRVSVRRVREIAADGGELPSRPCTGTGDRGGPKRLDHDPQAVSYARKIAGLTKSQLARACGVSPSLITEIEKGTRNATPAMILRFAEVLRCPPVVLRRSPDRAPDAASPN